MRITVSQLRVRVDGEGKEARSSQPIDSLVSPPLTVGRLRYSVRDPRSQKLRLGGSAPFCLRRLTVNRRLLSLTSSTSPLFAISSTAVQSGCSSASSLSFFSTAPKWPVLLIAVLAMATVTLLVVVCYRSVRK